MNFRSWQHWRWSGAGHKKSADEDAIKKIHSPAEKDRNENQSKS